MSIKYPMRASLCNPFLYRYSRWHLAMGKLVFTRTISFIAILWAEDSFPI